jgi:hypothetical protein
LKIIKINGQKEKNIVLKIQQGCDQGFWAFLSLFERCMAEKETKQAIILVPLTTITLRICILNSHLSNKIRS